MGAGTCPSCGHGNPAGARFCNDCGASLGGPTPSPEPRAYTPPHLVEKILASRSALRGERTLVICTHDLAEARELTERVAVLHRGRLVALGATEQVLGEGDPLALFRGEGRAA